MVPLEGIIAAADARLEAVMKLRNWIVVLTATLVLVQIAEAQDHWVTTWAAAPQARLQAPLGGQRGGPAPPANAAPASFNDQTIRMIVHTSLGGRRAREIG